MRATFLAGCLLLTPAVWAQTAGEFPEQAGASPRSPIAACAQSLEPDVTGLEAVEAACPGLEQTLQASESAPFISDSQRAELSRNVLLDLYELQQRYRGTAAQGAHVIDPATLPPLLESLQLERKAETPPGWFGRLKQWLRDRLNRAGADQDSWLSRWLDDFRLSDKASDAIRSAVVILVILVAVAVIINEARVAGLLRRRARRERAAAAAGAAAAFGPPALAELDRAAPGDQPSLLLRVLVATLVSTGRLRADRSLTHRELGSRAAFEDSEQRACFQRVAALAERVVYGGGAVPPDAAQVIEAGRGLNARLNAQSDGAAA